jgi:RNA polymerase sigma-70 factor, ECF subfamily
MDNMSPPSSRPGPDLGAIFDEHFDYVWATLRRLGVRDADREDLVHEVFLKVHARMSDYDVTRPLRPWLFGFAYHVAADHRRLARHRVEVLGGPTEAIAEDPAADEHVAAQEERGVLRAALDEINLAKRVLLVMHDIEGMPVPEIADTLEIPLNTAYSRLRLAREALAAAVTKIRHARGVR